MRRVSVGSVDETAPDVIERLTREMIRNYPDISPERYLYEHCDEEHRKLWLGQLSETEAAELEYYWEFYARPMQRFDDDHKRIMVLGGRGLGKTRMAAEYVRHWIETGRCRHIALVGATAQDLRKVIVEDVYTVGSGILQVCPPWNKPDYYPSQMRLYWGNPNYPSYEASCSLYTSENPDLLRGPAHDGAWVDELARMQKQEEVWSNLMFGARSGPSPRIIVTTTPKPTPFMMWITGVRPEAMPDLGSPPKFHVLTGSTFDNADNLAPEFLSDVVEQYQGTRLGAQELYGTLLLSVKGALWDMEMLERSRLPRDARLPPLQKRVVGVDPQTSKDMESEKRGRKNARHMTGIVVCGVSRRVNKQPPIGYILDDRSVNGTPKEWAKATISAYYDHDCHAVICERNQGGEMCRDNIHNLDPNIRVVLVTSTKSKGERAIPVSTRYEQSRIRHVGYFPDLESEMTTFSLEDEEKKLRRKNSPNRLDALVHALDYLMVSGRRRGVGRMLTRPI